METKANKQKNWISFRVKPEEYEKIYKHFKSTTCRKLSQYARKVLLNKPVTVNYRNQSADELLQKMIQLKNELNAIGNNYNQAVKKIHNMETVPEIKTWLLLNEASKQLMLKKVEEIKYRMNQVYDKLLTSE